MNVLALIVSVLALALLGCFAWQVFKFLLPLLIIGGIAYLIYRAVRKSGGDA